MSANAIDIGLTGIRNNRQKLELTSHNIVNSETENYERKSVVQQVQVRDGLVQGVNITAIEASTDPILEKELLDKVAEFNYVDTRRYYYEQINMELGKPGSDNSIDVYIADMFNELHSLSTNTQSPSQKLITVENITRTADKIAYLANELENMRYTIDREVEKCTKGLNATLREAFGYNQQINALPKGSLEGIENEGRLKSCLQEIAQYFPVKQYTDNNGKINVLTDSGLGLISPDVTYQVNYQAAGSADTFIKDEPLNQLYLSGLDTFGNDIGFIIVMNREGKSSEVKNTLGRGGKISALIDMRDKEIPKTLAQLDSLAKRLKDEFNKIHNTGTGYPPPTVLTGNTLASRDETMIFSGSVRVAVVDDTGQPIGLPDIPALDIDLSKLDTGDGAGSPNLQGIIKEINYHFGDNLTLHNKAKLGNIKDIKLVAASDAVTPSGTLSLDLELTNHSGKPADIRITSVTATDNASVNILGSYNNTTHTVQTGVTERTGLTGPSIQINNTAAPILYPYTITVGYEVVEGINVSTGTVTYQIDNPSSDFFNGIQNNRFSATSATGSATLTGPSLDSSVINAYLVDDEGNIIPNNSSQKGRLKLESSNSSYHIVVDQLDSKYQGNPAENILPTNDGFSAYFGLNDLFVRTDEASNWGNTKNTAIYLGVREDIKQSPNYLSTGKLTQTMQSTDPLALPRYTYEVTAGNNLTLNEFINLETKSYYFPSTAGMSASTLRLTSFASEIISFNSTECALAIKSADRHKIITEALQEKLESVRGVDLNTELANMVLYQQAFQASAKTLEITNELTQTLLSIV
jgi:flagellar hook-associated protein 1 FlgK